MFGLVKNRRNILVACWVVNNVIACRMMAQNLELVDGLNNYIYIIASS